MEVDQLYALWVLYIEKKKTLDFIHQYLASSQIKNGVKNKVFIMIKILTFYLHTQFLLQTLNSSEVLLTII